MLLEVEQRHANLVGDLNSKFAEISEVSSSINPLRFIPRFWLRMRSTWWRRSGEN